MSTGRVNLMLWALASALSTSAVVVLALALLRPDASAAVDGEGEAPGAGGGVAGGARRVAAGGTAALPPLSDFERVWSAPLRRPLAAAATAGPADAGALAPAGGAGEAGPSLTLVGTIGDSLAMVRTADGSIEARAAGESVAGAEVVSIRRSHVVLRYNGRSFTLDKPPEPTTRP